MAAEGRLRFESKDLKLDIIALILLALVVLAFFWPLILAGQWIPRGGGDLVSFLWPMYRFAARSLRAGVVPLWNPHLYSGAPFVADNQSGVFYPVNLLAFALFGEPSYGVMEALVVFHVWLAGAGLFAMARGMGLGRLAALVGGVAFALSDLFVTHVGNLNLNATAAWLPWLLLLTHRALTGGGPGWAAGAGAVLAVAALAGHGQMLLFLALAFVLYLLYRLAVDWQRGPWRALRTLGLAALIVAIGVGGAALMLLPAYEMAEHTGRGGLPYEEATRYSLPPRALVGLLAPDFYGRGPARFWGPWDRVEVGYAGVAAVVLAALAIVAECPLWTARLKHHVLRITQYAVRSTHYAPFPTGFFLFLVPLSLLLAMGGHAPLYGLLYRYAPTFDQVRAPARLILLADLGLAALAARGMDWLVRGRLRESSATSGAWNAGGWVGPGALAAAGILLAVGLPQARAVPPERVPQATTSILVAAALLGLSGGLVWLARRWRWAAWLLLPLLAADLIGLGAMLEAEPNDPTLGFRHDDVAAFLRRELQLGVPYRIESATAAWQPDAALVHGLYDVGGVYNPLGLAPYQAYRWAVGARSTPLYNLLGIKYVLAGKGQPPLDEGDEGDGQFVPVYTANPEIDVYLNTAALPRAFLVTRSHVVPDHGAAWEAIHAPDFDPARTVVLEEGQIANGKLQIADGELQGESGGVSFVQYGLNAVELAVRAPVGGCLVLSDVYYPGWRAAVDGAPAEVLRADYAFRAVLVPPGEHTVTMTFAPATWRVGLVVSVVTWVGLAAWVVYTIRCKGCTSHASR